MKYNPGKPSYGGSKARGKRRLNPIRVLLLAVIVVALLIALLLTIQSCDGPTASSDSVPPATTSAATFSAAGTAEESGKAAETSGQTSTAADATAAPTTAAGTRAVTSAPTKSPETPRSTGVTANGRYIQAAGAPWNLKLVNPWNKISQDISVTLKQVNGVKFDERITEELKALLEAGKPYNIRVTSGHRTIEFQDYLFNKNVTKEMNANSSLTREQAEAVAVTYSARPATSDHHTGLAVDFLFHDYSSLTEAYENTEAYAWMMKHCHEYGFILRYPKGKTDITGYTFEPWHYRYVGREIATEIMTRGLTFEEYLEEKGL